MNLGAIIQTKRKEKRISVEEMAKELGVSISTVYRYENSSIEKIPVDVFENICRVLGVTAAELKGGKKERPEDLPENFTNPQTAMEFILRMPTLAAYGGYNPEEMSEETIVEFANEILQQLKLVSYKYKK